MNVHLILLFILNVIAFVNMKSTFNDRLNALKSLVNNEKNLYIKNQMNVILNMKKYSLDPSEGTIYDKQSLKRASLEIIFPVKGLFEEWVYDNTVEKVDELITSLDLNFKLIGEEEFFDYLMKINPEDILGKFLWKKVKDLDINFKNKNEEL